MENILMAFLAELSAGSEQLYKKLWVLMGYLFGILCFFVPVGLIWLSFVLIDTYWKVPYSNLFNIPMIV